MGLRLGRVDSDCRLFHCVPGSRWVLLFVLFLYVQNRAESKPKEPWVTWWTGKPKLTQESLKPAVSVTLHNPRLFVRNMSFPASIVGQPDERRGSRRRRRRRARIVVVAKPENLAKAEGHRDRKAEEGEGRRPRLPAEGEGEEPHAGLHPVAGGDQGGEEAAQIPLPLPGDLS